MKKVIVLMIGASILTSCKFFSVNTERLDSLINNYELEQLMNTDDYTIDNDTDMIGSITTKTVMVEDFSRITIDGAYEMHYSIGEPAIVINAPEKQMEKITVSQNGKHISISTKNKNVRWNDVCVYVTSPTLECLTVNGAVDFDAHSGIEAEALEINVYGAGDIEIDGLKAGSVAVNMSGAGDVEIDNLDAADLSLTVKGAGDIQVSGHAGKADVVVEGVGSIDVRNLDCPVLSTSKNGFGSIKR